MTENDPRVVFHNHAWLLLLPASLFAIVGSMFGTLGVYELVHGGAWLPTHAALGAGVLGLASAVYIYRQAERITVTFDCQTQLVVLEGRLLWRRRREQWRFDEVETVDVEQWDDTDGPLWRPYMLTKIGARVPLMASWDKVQDGISAKCARARALLAVN
jgi:hypothetical protein